MLLLISIILHVVHMKECVTIWRKLYEELITIIIIAYSCGGVRPHDHSTESCDDVTLQTENGDSSERLLPETAPVLLRSTDTAMATTMTITSTITMKTPVITAQIIQRNYKEREKGD